MYPRSARVRGLLPATTTTGREPPYACGMSSSNRRRRSLVSLGPDGAFSAGVARGPSVTDDGRYVHSLSTGNDLVTDADAGAADEFVRDLQTRRTTWAGRAASNAATVSRDPDNS
jgi:hypothetical protein